MGKKITDQQRLINFAMGADEEALKTAIESLQAIKANRYPQRKPSASRKPRSDKGTQRTPAEPLSDERRKQIQQALPKIDAANGGASDAPLQT